MRQANNFSTIEKIHHFRILEEALERKLNKIKYLEERNTTNFKLCKIGIIVQKSLGDSVFDTVYEYVGMNHDVKYKKPLNRTGYRYFNKVEGDLDEARSTADSESQKAAQHEAKMQAIENGSNTMGAIEEIASDQEVSDVY